MTTTPETQRERVKLAEKLLKKLGDKRRPFLFKLLLALRPDLSTRQVNTHVLNFEELSEDWKIGFLQSAMFPTSLAAQRAFDVSLCEIDSTTFKAFETRIKNLR